MSTGKLPSQHKVSKKWINECLHFRRSAIVGVRSAFKSKKRSDRRPFTLFACLLEVEARMTWPRRSGFKTEKIVAKTAFCQAHCIGHRAAAWLCNLCEFQQNLAVLLAVDCCYLHRSAQRNWRECNVMSTARRPTARGNMLPVQSWITMPITSRKRHLRCEHVKQVQPRLSLAHF